MRIGANPNSLQQDSADEIISKAHLNEIFYDFNPNGTYTVESEVIYHPYELEEVKSEFTNDFKNHQEAKRSDKDIPEQTAMKLFNEHISRANREIANVAEALRNRQFRVAMKHLSAKWEVDQANIVHHCQNKVVSMVFQGEGHENESIITFNNRFQLALRILTIVTGLKSDNIVNSNKAISYPDRLTQDANSGDKSDEEIKNTLLPNGNPVRLIITENQRREWYINALKANPLNIFKSLISLLETESRPFRDTMTMVQARYTKYLDDKTKQLSEENKVLKIQKLVPKGNLPNVTKININKKRSIDNITPNTPKVIKEAKLYCKICDFNSTHITNDCKKLSKLILDQTNKPVVQKINKDIKIEKHIKSDNKVSKDTKIKSRSKVNKIKIEDYCTYCLKFG
jgi:hypothetical protein